MDDSDTRHKNGNLIPEVVPPEHFALQARIEIDTAVATAKQYPRKVSEFISRATNLIREDKGLAADCIYAKPCGRDTHSGPSVRLAEVVLSEWGNVAAEIEIIEEGETHVTARAVVWDMERNVRVTVPSRRPILTKNGRRFPQHLVESHAMGAGSIAFRNAVFRVIPKAHVLRLYNEAIKVSVGTEQTLPERREAMLAHFAAMGISADRIYGSLGVSGVDDLGMQELLNLRGIASAIKAGDTTADKAFPEPKTEVPDGERQAFGKKPRDEKAAAGSGPPVDESEALLNEAME